MTSLDFSLRHSDPIQSKMSIIYLLLKVLSESIILHWHPFYFLIDILNLNSPNKKSGFDMFFGSFILKVSKLQAT